MRLDGCVDVCAVGKPMHFLCISWWFWEQKKRGVTNFKCPNCTAPCTGFKDGQLNRDSVFAFADKVQEDSVGEGVGGRAAAAAVAAPMVLGQVAEAVGNEFDIKYIAGIKVVGVNLLMWKVVWCPRDVKDGEKRWEWVELCAVSENSSKANEFLKRWNIPTLSTLPVGYVWSHPVPKRLSTGEWKCTKKNCGYKTKEMSNCRKHAGATHSKSHFVCGLCAERCSTNTNLDKHLKLKHA